MITLIAPDGTLGEVSAEQVEAAIEAGALVPTEAMLAELYTRQHMADIRLQQEWKKKHKGFRRPLRWKR